MEDPFEPVLTSPWWDYDAHSIDILSTDYRRALFVDINVNDHIINKTDYRSFVEQTQLVPFKTKLRQKYYYFVSLKGFTADFEKVVKNRKTVKLLTFDQMVDEM